jgi:hypothetical protein
MGLWPLLGALFMIYIFIEAYKGLNTTTRLVGLGAMALGFVPIAWYWFVKRNPYFKMALREDRHAVLQEFEQNL